MTPRKYPTRSQRTSLETCTTVHVYQEARPSMFVRM